jgi:hypothetical protein
MPSTFNSVVEALGALLDQLGRGITPTEVGAVATAPAAGTVITDTGALPAGVYRVEAVLGISGAVAAGKHVVLEHRNAVNSATVTSLALCPAGVNAPFVFERLTLAANERLRVLTGIILAASEVAQGSIVATLLPA